MIKQKPLSKQLLRDEEYNNQYDKMAIFGKRTQKVK